MAKETSTEKW